MEVEVFTTALTEGQKLVYTIYDHAENELQKIESTDSKVNFEIKDVHLWHGRRDPYLYCCEVELVENGEVLETSATVSAAAASRSTPTTALSSTARSILCGAYPVTRTVGASVTHCFPSITKRILT